MFSQVGKLDQNRNGDRIIHFYLFYNQLRQKGLIQEGFSLLRFFLNDQFLDLIMEIIKEEWLNSVKEKDSQPEESIARKPL